MKSPQMRLFADDSSLFTPVKGITETHERLVGDLQVVSDWGYQWKMVFNPDITKQAVEVVFSVKNKKPLSSTPYFQQYITGTEGSYQTSWYVS